MRSSPIPENKPRAISGCTNPPEFFHIPPEMWYTCTDDGPTEQNPNGPKSPHLISGQSPVGSGRIFVRPDDPACAPSLTKIVVQVIIGFWLAVTEDVA
jgi:hypothetical protein